MSMPLLTLYRPRSVDRLITTEAANNRIKLAKVFQKIHNRLMNEGYRFVDDKLIDPNGKEVEDKYRYYIFAISINN